VYYFEIKINGDKMKKILFILVMLAVRANAQNIPVLYKNNCASAIKIPNAQTHPDIQELISDFETDENCTKIFVHPPKFGRLRLFQYMPSALTEAYCPGIKKDVESFLSITNKMNNASSTTQYDQLEATRTKIANEFKKVEYVTGVTLKVVLDMEWDKLVDAYKQLNPNVSVLKLQLHSTILGNEDINYFEDSPDYVLGSVLYSKFPGLERIREEKNLVLGLDETPDINLSNSLSGKLILSMTGACPFYNLKEDKFDFKIKDEAQKSPMAALAINMLYSYRVKSQTSYGLEFDAARLNKEINSLYNPASKSSFNLQVVDLLGTVRTQVKILTDTGSNELLMDDLLKSFVTHLTNTAAISVNGEGDLAKIDIDTKKLEQTLIGLKNYYSKSPEHQIVVRSGTLSFQEY
jgi:hypothetical protein